MLDKILKEIDNLPDEYIVIGVSAGPDSMALLHMITNNTSKNVVCAHVNHNVRKESNEEEKYLKKYCLDHNIIFESAKITKYSQNNFENEAREKRYTFYEKVLNKYKSHYLLLAHHGDDLIETVIMKIIRGTNLEGYAGIKTYSNQRGYTIIRPLLCLTKKDILIYNKENKIEYFIDNTNEDTTYTRNRLRKNILPLLKEEDPNVHLKFLEYSNIIQSYYNYVEDVVKDRIDTKYKNNVINISKFKKEHPLIQRNIIFGILSGIYENKTNIIKNSHIDAIISLVNNSNPNKTIDLPEGYIAKKEYDNIYLKKNAPKKSNYKIEFTDNIKIGNIIINKETNIETDGNDVCRLNSNNIKFPLYLRNKKNGDYIEVLGLNGKKKIKDIFIEKKIPIDKRSSYPLLVDADDNILWIPNIKKSKYNAKKGEKYDIILTSYEESEECNEKETK